MTFIPNNDTIQPMLSNIRKNYKYTIRACYLGYVTQAVVNNFVPLLFLTLASDFSLSLSEITFITTINFSVQLLVDLLSVKFIDKIGYRLSMVLANLFCFAGLSGLSFLPQILGGYTGIIVSVILYAVGGGILEVLVSPIVESCPTENKATVMSMLHSFYCWGHVFVVLASTLFFKSAGIQNWPLMAVIWSLMPAANAVLFILVPIYPVVSEGTEKVPLKKLLSDKYFYLIAVIMICAGASEQAVSQWASAFAESALGVSKLLGDLAGPCAFAFFMGVSRFIYGKYGTRLPLEKTMLLCSVMCIVCYLVIALSAVPAAALVACALTGFSVGIFWPGTFSIAAKRIPGGGTAMYALLALAGDTGCSSGPTLVGLAAGLMGGKLSFGIGLAILFPFMILLGIVIINGTKKNG